MCFGSNFPQHINFLIENKINYRDTIKLIDIMLNNLINILTPQNSTSLFFLFII